jgi:hypothetical protein
MYQAYDCKRSLEPLKSRVESMDVMDSLMCYADARGYVYTTQLLISGTEYKLEEVKEAKVGVSSQM